MSASHPELYVCVYASQVAVCIGANRHKKASEALESMWQRISPHTFHAALRRNGIKTEDDVVSELMEKSDLVRDLVGRSLQAANETSSEVAASYESAARDLHTAAASGTASELRSAELRLVDDVVKRNLYTSYGNVQEHRSLKYVREVLGIDCRPDPTFYKKQCGTTDGGTPWYVGGKIDAISADRSTVIEIKNRVNRLFRHVPFYETVQVQTYLHLLDVEQGALVECLKTGCPGEDAPGAHDDLEINLVPFKRDEDLWTREIVPKLQGFVDFLEALLRDTRLQDRYLQSPRRSVLVLNYISARTRGFRRF